MDARALWASSDQFPPTPHGCAGKSQGRQRQSLLLTHHHCALHSLPRVCKRRALVCPLREEVEPPPYPHPTPHFTILLTLEVPHQETSRERQQEDTGKHGRQHHPEPGASFLNLPGVVDRQELQAFLEAIHVLHRERHCSPETLSPRQPIYTQAPQLSTYVHEPSFMQVDAQVWGRWAQPRAVIGHQVAGQKFLKAPPPATTAPGPLAPLHLLEACGQHPPSGPAWPMFNQSK